MEMRCIECQSVNLSIREAGTWVRYVHTRYSRYSRYCQVTGKRGDTRSTYFYTIGTGCRYGGVDD